MGDMSGVRKSKHSHHPRLRPLVDIMLNMASKSPQRREGAAEHDVMLDSADLRSRRSRVYRYRDSRDCRLAKHCFSALPATASSSSEPMKKRTCFSCLL